jgi:hypothetical protein
MTKNTPHFWLTLVLTLFPLSSPASEEAEREQARFYVTPEDRREGGVGFQLTDWLQVSGLLEFEQVYRRDDRVGNAGFAESRETVSTLQLGATLTPVRGVKAELVLEYDDEERDTLRYDEAIVAIEAGDFELAAGMLYAPFGVYFSHFFTDPALQFGETRDTGVTLSYAPDHGLDVSLFAIRGRARNRSADRQPWDWGVSFEISPSRYGLFGAGYLSDLADSDARFLEDADDRYRRRVAAWNAYAILGTGAFEFAAELVQALDSYRELETDRDKPSAWNLELAWFPEGNIEWALRLEESSELADAPRRRAGVAIAWRATRNVSLTLEYLRGVYKKGLAEDDNGNALRADHSVGIQLGVLF